MLRRTVSSLGAPAGTSMSVAFYRKMRTAGHVHLELGLIGACPRFCFFQWQAVIGLQGEDKTAAHYDKDSGLAKDNHRGGGTQACMSKKVIIQDPAPSFSLTKGLLMGGPIILIFLFYLNEGHSLP